MEPPGGRDVIVVGGGVIGLAVAWRLAVTGVRTTVVDASGTQGASWAAAGMLAPVSEASFGEEDLLRLNLAAVARFPEFVRELEAASGCTVGLRDEGTLVVALDADDREALERLSRFRSSLGLAADRLTGSAVRRLEPYLTPDIRGGVLARGDYSVHNRDYAVALRAAAQGAGVEILADRVVEILVEAGRARGVRAEHTGELRCDTVVLAAGAWTAGLPGLPEAARPPVRPVKGQILRLGLPPSLRPNGPVLTHTVRALVRGSEVYLVPRADGELVVGATVEERGFDEVVTAGGVYTLLRDAYQLLPVVSELELVEARAALRPGTPDNAPVLGWSSLPGLLLATGHYRNGILLSAITADAVTALVDGDEPGPEWAPCTPERFGGKHEHE
ncbi:MAG TPA: glycine oxidase ThiO [Micromonosporaceae bacterium]